MFGRKAFKSEGLVMDSKVNNQEKLVFILFTLGTNIQSVIEATGLGVLM